MGEGGRRISVGKFQKSSPQPKFHFPFDITGKPDGAEGEPEVVTSLWRRSQRRRLRKHRKNAKKEARYASFSTSFNCFLLVGVFNLQWEIYFYILNGQQMVCSVLLRLLPRLIRRLHHLRMRRQSLLRRRRRRRREAPTLLKS